MFLALLIALTAFASVSCDSQGQPASKKIGYQDNTLRFDVAGPFGSLDPTVGDLLASTFITPLLYSYLFVRNREGQLEPELAIQWDYDPKRYTWTIQLRDDAFFHNKRRVTAKDIEYSLTKGLKKYTFGVFSSIERIESASETTINLMLNRDDPDFLLSIWDTEIVPKPREGSTDVDTYNHPIGSGPFRFQYRDGEKEVGLVANADYFGGCPSLDRIIFYYFSDSEKSWARLLSGKTDVVNSIYPKDFEMIRQYEQSFQFNAKVLCLYTLLLFNTADPLFSDPKVRLALSHAVDKEYLVQKILRGTAVVAAGPMGIGSPYHNPQVAPVPFNPAKGRKLLEEAGWTLNEQTHCLEKDGRCFDFTIFIFDGYQVHRRIAEYLQLCFYDLGIKAHLQSLPFDVVLKRYSGNNEFQAVLTEFSGARDAPENLCTLWAPGHGGSTSAGAGSFSHPVVTSLFQEVLREKDASARTKLFFELDDLLNSLQPGIFLFHRRSLDAISRRIELYSAFELNTAGIHHLRHASVGPH